MAPQIEIKVPDIGDFKDVAVIEVMVKAGETVAVDTGLIMVESDKASMEIPSSHAGVVKEVRVKVDDKVSEGSTIVVLETASAAAAPKPAPASQPAAAPPPAVPAAAFYSGKADIEYDMFGARRRPRWLLGRFPRRRSRHEDSPGRTL
jgi:dihydrolipoamide dehydrogenase